MSLETTTRVLLFDMAANGTPRPRDLRFRLTKDQMDLLNAQYRAEPFKKKHGLTSLPQEQPNCQVMLAVYVLGDECEMLIARSICYLEENVVLLENALALHSNLGYSTLFLKQLVTYLHHQNVTVLLFCGHAATYKATQYKDSPFRDVKDSVDRNKIIQYIQQQTGNDGYEDLTCTLSVASPDPSKTVADVAETLSGSKTTERRKRPKGTSKKRKPSSVPEATAADIISSAAKRRKSTSGPKVPKKGSQKKKRSIVLLDANSSEKEEEWPTNIAAASALTRLLGVSVDCPLVSHALSGRRSRPKGRVIVWGGHVGKKEEQSKTPTPTPTLTLTRKSKHFGATQLP